MSVLFSLVKGMFLRPSGRGNGAHLAVLEHDLQTALAHGRAGRLSDAERVYRSLLQTHPHNPEVNHKLGELLLLARQPEAAHPYLLAALNSSPANNQYCLSLAECLVQLQAWEEAAVLLDNARFTEPEQEAAEQLRVEVSARLEQARHIDAAKNRFPGPDYFEWLKWLHATVRPAGYVEIGVETGRSLQFAQNPTRSVGIDPEAQIIFSLESWAKVYRLPSDDFFAQHDLRKVLDGLAVDMAFIDGLHTFDQALKDFINIERHAHSGTVVAFHDIFPVTPVTAARERETIFWLGDTWKVVLILKEMRPDLKIFTLPTFPSGLTLVTGLDGNSRLLSQELQAIIERWMSVDLDAYMAEIDTHLNVVGNDVETVSRLLGR